MTGISPPEVGGRAELKCRVIIIVIVAVIIAGLIVVNIVVDSSHWSYHHRHRPVLTSKRPEIKVSYEFHV